MKWFEGSISDAVTTSKSRKAIFVVFVEGNDDASVQVAQAIGSPDVSRRLEQEDFVAVRVEGGSESYTFFAQIYKLVPVPSIFFIGENGAPLQIVAGATTAQELSSKIDAALVKAGKTTQSASVNFINAEQKAEATNKVDNIAKDVSTSGEAKAKADSAPVEKPQEKLSENNSTNQDNTKDEKPAPSLASVQSTTSVPEAKAQDEASAKELTPEERVERARQLIEVQRRQRVEEEEKKDIKREIERRKTGRDVQKSRQRQQELEIKQVQDERMKEKADEAAAKERVRRQIEQDKLERKQRELALQQENQKKPSSNPILPQAPVPSDATVTRIQFRLPTGNPYTAQFEPTSTLGALRTYIVQNIELPFKQFSMSTSFPRRDLTHEDNTKTLLQLELVPTAVILILPIKNSTPTSAVTSSSQDVGFLSRFVWSLFAPIIGVYNYIASYFSRDGRPNEGDQQRDTSGVRSAGTADGPALPNLQNLANASLVRRFMGNQGGTKIRAEGNIHRLHSGGDDNDENNTWNGNSTQQM